jgi:hypothetical protein
LEILTTRKDVEDHIRMYPDDEEEGTAIMEQMSPGVVG